MNGNFVREAAWRFVPARKEAWPGVPAMASNVTSTKHISHKYLRPTATQNTFSKYFPVQTHNKPLGFDFIRLGK